MSKSRMTFEFPLEFRARLDQIREETGAASVTEVLRRSVAVYGYLVDQQKDGTEVVFRKGDRESNAILIP